MSNKDDCLFGSPSPQQKRKKEKKEKKREGAALEKKSYFLQK